MIPPAAPSVSTAISVAGVVASPRSATSRPAAVSPAATARWTIGPERRASRPTTISPGGISAANAAAKRLSTGGVSDSPTMPRTPATLIMSGAFMGRARYATCQEATTRDDEADGSTHQQELPRLLDSGARGFEEVETAPESLQADGDPLRFGLNRRVVQDPPNFSTREVVEDERDLGGGREPQRHRSPIPGRIRNRARQELERASLGRRRSDGKREAVGTVREDAVGQRQLRHLPSIGGDLEDVGFPRAHRD